MAVNPDILTIIRHRYPYITGYSYNGTLYMCAHQKYTTVVGVYDIRTLDDYALRYSLTNDASEPPITKHVLTRKTINDIVNVLTLLRRLGVDTDFKWKYSSWSN